ncbi:hypothetical protein LCGC14_0871910 [marine sediment metagenome]|uniref:Uncharacterized protein n=1 Tax=marine sediment metagenome TaxID=412755 RepID=A0A0F9RP21_9ZZZZ
MKIRNGFVSNSSSSSFILITDAGSHKKVLESMKTHENGEHLAKVMDSIVGRKELGLGSVHYPEVEIVILQIGSGEMFEYDDDLIFRWKGLDHVPVSQPGKYGQSIKATDDFNSINCATDLYEETIEKLNLPYITQTMDM